MSPQLARTRIRAELLGSAHATLESLGFSKIGKVYAVETSTSTLRLWLDFHRRVPAPRAQVRAVLELINKPESDQLGLEHSTADGGYVERIVFIGPKGVQLAAGWWTISTPAQLQAACTRLRLELLGRGAVRIAEMKKLRLKANRNRRRRAALAQLVTPNARERVSSKKLQLPIELMGLVEVEHVGMNFNPQLVQKWRASQGTATHAARRPRGRRGGG